MRAIWFVASAFLLSGAGLAADAPAYSGKFVVHYNPIYCVRAPCPPGNFVFWAGDAPLGSAKTVEMEAAPAEGAVDLVSAARGSDGVAIEGELRFEAETGKAFIKAVRMIPGEWKTETPPPETDAKGAAPVALIVVNKTRDVIRGVFVAPAGADHWGQDRLTDNLAINQRITLDLPAADCLYDVRIVLGARPAEEIRRIDTCKSATFVADRSGLIIDRSR